MSVTNAPVKIDTSLMNIQVSQNNHDYSNIIKIKSIDDYFDIIEKCYNYTYSFKDFIFPPIETFKFMCISYDKTYLFIISFIRCIFYLLLLKVYTDIVDITDYWNNLIFMLLIIICIIHIIIFLYVTLKKTKTSPYQLSPSYQNNKNYNSTDLSKKSFYEATDNIYG